MDTTVLVAGARGAARRRDESERAAAAQDVARFLLRNASETSRFAYTEFELTIWRIFAAAHRAFESSGVDGSRDVFHSELMSLCTWSYDPVVPFADAVFEYLKTRLRNEDVCMSLKPWLRGEMQLRIESVALLLKERIRDSAVVFRRPATFSGREPNPDMVVDKSRLKSLLAGIGARDFRTALSAFAGLNEEEALLGECAEHQSIFRDGWHEGDETRENVADRADIDEAVEVVADCAEALGDLLIFFETREGSDLCTSDLAFEALCQRIQRNISYRCWHPHRLPVDEPAEVQTETGSGPARVVQRGEHGARIRSDWPIAPVNESGLLDGSHPPVEVSISGRKHRAKIVWGERRRDSYLYGLSLS